MNIFKTLLIGSCMFFIMFPGMSRSKIFDINSENSLFHPYIQRIRNYRNKDYLIKLLKRNLEQKLRKNRKFIDDNRFGDQDQINEKQNKNSCDCDCKCNNRNFEKRCEQCHQNSQSEGEQYKNFICESEGSFAKPNNCRQFYVCFHSEKDPIEVTCPKGFAFDSEEGKCSRKAARQCRKKQMSIYKN